MANSSGAMALKQHGFTALVHGGALYPAARMALELAGGRYADPVRQLTTRTGNAALALLFLTLTCTPLDTLFGLKAALRARRALGLYSFGYAAAHLLIFAGWDYGFEWAFLGPALVGQRFTLVGLLAFAVLLVLALTSTRGWQQRLGRWWKRVQRLVYAAAILAVAHVLWLSKTPDKALRYGVILGALLLVRLPPVRAAIVSWRQRLRKA